MVFLQRFGDPCRYRVGYIVGDRKAELTGQALRNLRTSAPAFVPTLTKLG